MRLSSQQMARMSRLLDEALTLDLAGRRAWLDSLATDQEDLFPALREALLGEGSSRSTSEALETLPKIGAGELIQPGTPTELQLGARIGPYELIRHLGSGGMAQVWLARRADGAIKREVALKVPRRTSWRADLQERFVREREILASLEHPQIARLYDVGTDAQGLPYLAMEYVRGQPLTDWCDARRLPISERVRLFLQVLEAVQYAHECHVVHRDLKPSNILVSESGQVHLLDFGIAKLLEDADADQTQLTQIHGRALTPDYASPELLRGDRIEASSDVYSLGVLLYELLSGSRPYRLKTTASLGVLDQVLTTIEVAKPSTRIEGQSSTVRGTTPDKVARQLRGDLDAITLKALARAPENRYPAAAALAEDLRRYLQGQPVRAGPATSAYRLRKLLLRNRVPTVVVVIAILVVLLVDGVAWLRGSRLSVPSAASIAVLPLANESGEASQQYFSDGISEDLITALSQFPGLKVIGRTSAFQFRNSKDDSRSIGVKLGVARLLEGSVRRSGEMVRVSAELIDTTDGTTQWSERYDRPYKDLFSLQDEITQAVVAALQVKLLRDDHTAVLGERPPNGSLEAYNALLLGRFYRYRRTEADIRKAIGYYTQATQLDPRYALAWSTLSRTWTSLSAMYLEGAPAQGAYIKAREAADRALALAPDLSLAHVARGDLLQIADLDWHGAEEEYRRALALAPNDGLAKFSYGTQLATFGELERAIDFTRQALATEPLQHIMYGWLAGYLLGLNRLDEAERAIQKAIEMQPGGPQYHAMLSTIEIQRGNAQAALEAAQQEPDRDQRNLALALVRQIGGDRGAADAAIQTLIDEPTTRAYEIAEVYALRNDPKATFEWLDRALSNREPGFGNLLYDPIILRYKDDLRFAALCRKAGLPVPGENRQQTR